MTNFILMVAVLLPALIVLGVLFIWRSLRNRDGRRSPLTFKVLNLPGEGLRRAIRKHEELFSEAAVVVLLIGPYIVASWALLRIDRLIESWSDVRFGAGDFIFLITGVAVLLFSAWRLIHHASRRRMYVQGLAAELAVAQSLISLVADGGMVYHDFPADKFNIDHIVIGESAVFAIETKSRRKPAKGGSASARVSYDGSILKFPVHTETKPIDQARRQAQWLERFLASGVGEPVRVIPVLALPGWYTQNTIARPDVLLTNCHNPSFMMSTKFGSSLGPAMRKRIAHVLTERYPQLEE